jgi:tetratricopeptide (TPR) repeat protein
MEPNDNKQPTYNPNRLFQITVALLLLAIGALWYWHFQGTPEPIANEVPRQNPGKQAPKTTVTRQSIPDQIYRTPAAQPLDADKIFEKYFRPTPSRVFPSAAGRRGEPQTAFFRLYDAGKFQEALSAFPSTNQKDDNWLFFKAICLLKSGKTKESATLFEGIITRGQTNFSSNSHWYLGLAHLKMNQIEEARQSLKLYLIEAAVKEKNTVRQLLLELQ